ncbi:hypothetical protein RJT34_13025 [Clitoria ternatea]|uniref:Uncharacterized protein n=1 Tax=Clitoria ternatea TaxID=43366 RepID=A0AAN9JPX0_CLITE
MSSAEYSSHVEQAMQYCQILAYEKDEDAEKRVVGSRVLEILRCTHSIAQKPNIFVKPCVHSSFLSVAGEAKSAPFSHRLSLSLVSKLLAASN